jgi:hypothetical protein
MTPVVGVVAIVALAVAWFIGRSTAKAMRKKKQRKRRLPKRRPAPVVHVKRSTRSEMRAAEDQTTIAGEMNTITRPGAEQEHK